MRLNSPHNSPPEKQRRWGRLSFSLSTIVLLIVGCIYDPDKRCNEGQILETEGTESCICAEGYLTTATGCKKCGENEIVGATACVCKDNYGRTNENASCEPCGKNEVTSATGTCECKSGFGKESPKAECKPLPAGIGVACDATATPCTDATYNYCYTGSATTGYCTTQGCATNGDCENGYMCDLNSTPSYCRRAPLGAGKVCTTDADCAGTEATYCDKDFSKTCLVQGCTVTPDNCFTGTECCDLSQYGLSQPLCIAAGFCTT
jgi:hypothetical protein